jgi:phosphatidylinositol 4-kinase A
MPIVLQLAPGDDLGMSYMYSLLNHIAATSKEPYEAAVAMNNNTLSDSIETGLRGLTEEEKRLVAISTISVVTRLALEFKDEEVAQWLFMLVLVAH